MADPCFPPHELAFKLNEFRKQPRCCAACGVARADAVLIEVHDLEPVALRLLAQQVHLLLGERLREQPHPQPNGIIASGIIASGIIASGIISEPPLLMV